MIASEDNTTLMRPMMVEFDGRDVRFVVAGGETLVIGKDLCDVLGYADPTTAMRSHCRGVQKLHPIADSLGRMQDTRVLTQGDMFRLITNSTLPAAERFERLVFDEILPTIHKHGCWPGPQSVDDQDDPLQALLLQHDTLRGVIVRQIEMGRQLRETQAVQERQAKRIEQLADSRESFEQRMEEVMQRKPLPSTPADMENITSIKRRMASRYGLPGEIVAYVMRESTHKLIPSATVASEHSEDFRAPPFSVYYIAVVSSVFARFVKECVRVDERRAEHPSRPGRKFLLSERYGSVEHVDVPYR